MMENRNWKKIIAIILLAYAGLAVLLYIATGFPDPSCGCPIKVMIFFSAMASPVLTVIALVLILMNRKAAQ